MKQSAVALALAFPALVGCGQHIGIDIDSLNAVREQDDRVAVNAGIQVSVTGDPKEAEKVDEVCVEAQWAEELVADGGSLAGDGGVVGGATSTGTSDGGSTRSDPQAKPRSTGPTLFSAKSCTQERFKDREVKVLTVRSTEPIPKKPLLITISVTGSAPNAGLSLAVRDYMGNQIPNP
jgi:hypothetical protein